MKKILAYVTDYFKMINRWVLLLSTLITGIAVFINYHFHLNAAILQLSGIWPYLAWFGLFLLLFSVGYWLPAVFNGARFFRERNFLWLLLLAPAIFAWKMTYPVHYVFTENKMANEYWNGVLYWPFKVVVVITLLWIVHQLFHRHDTFYGMTTRNFSGKPYLIMLLIMVPLIAIASTQPDFLHMYPRMQRVSYLSQPDRGWNKLLYELSYGSDFLSIELFFRGFLVLGFARWAGKNAILPMAIFYCAIHFGKPLGECISSYFGGMILGIVSYHTRSILGGFLVHVGIAWLMELGGYWGATIAHLHPG